MAINGCANAVYSSNEGSPATANHVHFGPAKMALENGFHVICDKPVCFNLKEAQTLEKLVEKTGLVFALTHNYTGYPMVKQARQMIKNGELGAIRKVVVEYPQGWLSTNVEASGQKQAAWRTDPKRSGIAGAMGDIGTYLAEGTRPEKGLAVARMAAHITYLSETALKRKFDRKLQDRQTKTFGFDADFQIESYLRHQGQTFVDRFDANSYLYITRAMDYFDLASEHGGVLANAFRGLNTRFCVFSFSSDWHYSPEENRDLVRALNAAGCETSYVNIETDKGHDAFFVEEPEFEAGLRGFVDAAANARGLPKARA